jgi:ABC-type phosphate transport system auxiliary subunit
MGPGETMAIFITIIIPTLFLAYIANRYFRLRERKLEIEAGIAAEKAAQYASRTHELEQRLRVIEQIVTDRGLETASQIEALRDTKRIAKSEDAR